jgi:hypothetical protein
VHALRGEDTSVRDELIKAIGKVGGEPSMQMLRQALADDEEALRGNGWN